VVGLLERHRVRFVCLAILCMSLALLAVSFATSDRGQTVFGASLGADYIGFYAAATILNTAAPDRLYDFALQDEIYHTVLPSDEGHLPFFHPPFVALAFRPLARLPYAWSFAAWLLLSAGLYLGGLHLILKTRAYPSGQDRGLAMLLALSFEPFIMECWIGGQLSAFGFFCMALACYCLDVRRQTAAGVALGFCLYKPTLLVLLLPLLVVGRCWRILFGFSLSAAALAGVTLVAMGWQGCLAYARTLLGFAHTTTGNEGAILPFSKFVDLNSFFRLLLGGQSPVPWAVLPLMLAAPLGSLALAWWRIGRHGEVYRRAVWAATLTWTLVANLYVGVYDSVLVVLGALLTADVLQQRGEAAGPFRSPTFPVLLVLLYLGPWVSQPLALLTGVQLYTLILLFLGTYQLLLIHRIATASGGIGDGEHRGWLPPPPECRGDDHDR